MESINVTTTTLPVLVGTIGVGLITTAVVIVLSRSLFFVNNKKNDGSTKTHNVSSVGNNPKAALQQQQASKTRNTTNTINASRQNSNKPAAATTTTSDVWEERRQRGIPAASLHIKKDIDHKGVKPFGSSYYYAHNSTKTTGGYKDGLTMEDYTMNGPRLLSRNGTPVIDNCSPETLTPENVQQQQQQQKGVQLESMVESVQIEDNSLMNKRNSVTTTTRIIHITKYLWDDPGNSKDGIATLRIDTVPSYHKSNTSDDTIPWKDIRPYIQTISASILPNDTNKKGDTNGLYVKIEVLIVPSNNNDNSIVAPNDATNSSSNNGMNHIDYVLKISKLYGRVQRVEYKNKEKRLLIQLYKYSTLLDQSNLKAWPYPQQRLI